MIEVYVGLIINFFLMFLALRSVEEIIFTKTNANLKYKKITNRGKTLILAALGVIFFSFWKDCRNANQIATDLKIQKTKDSIYKKDILSAIDSVDSSNTRNIVDALIKYNLNYNRKSDSIVRVLRDSVKTIINNNSAQPDPFYGLCQPPQGRKAESIRIKSINQFTDSVYMDFCCTHNTSYHINCFVAIIKLNVGDTSLTQGVVMDDQKVSDGSGYTAFMQATRLENFNEIYFRVIGNYKNDKGNKFLIDEFYRFDISTSSYLTYNTVTKRTFDNYLSKKIKLVQTFFKTGLMKF